MLAAQAETLGVWVPSYAIGGGMFRMHATIILTTEVREHVSVKEQKR